MRRLPDSPRKGAAITVELDGEPIPAIEGEPVACAMLAVGEDVFARSVKYHRPRGATCFAASCSNCLMRVDGIPNQFTCQVPARAGMRLERQNAFPSAKLDIFNSIDWLFPKGLDHHEMFAGVPVAENVMAKVARHLAGLGVLPTQAAPERPPLEVVRTPVCIVGAGAAGLAASAALSESSLAHWLVEQDGEVGGRFFQKSSLSPFCSLALKTRVVGLYLDGDEKFLLAVSTQQGHPRLLKIHAQSYLLAAGGHASLLAFENNDLPGVFTSHAAHVLLRREGLVPGEAVALVGDASSIQETRALFDAFHVNVVLSLVTEGAQPEGTLLKAHGPTRVRGLSFLPRTDAGTSGSKRRVDCDAIVIALPPTSRFELARQGGARVQFSETHRGFVVEADEAGATQVPDIFVAGDATGPKTQALAGEQGRAAAARILQRAGAAR